MRIPLSSITVKERIRKESGDISVLAEDITANGLISPIAVMPCGGGYQLLAGLRRLKAVTQLGHHDIEASVFEPKDAVDALKIEISENEQRKPFTFSEKAYFIKLLADVEKAKAAERMSAGGQGGIAKVVPTGTTLAEKTKGRAAEHIGAALGVGRTTFERINYLADNAPPEMIEQLDRKECSIHRAFDELKAQKKAETLEVKPPSAKPAQPAPPPKLAPQSRAPKGCSPMDLMSKKEAEAIRKLAEFNAMPPEGKIEELQRQLREERGRVAELEHLKSSLQNDLNHKTSLIDNLKKQLADAHDKIKELELKYGAH